MNSFTYSQNWPSQTGVIIYRAYVRFIRQVARSVTWRLTTMTCAMKVWVWSAYFNNVCSSCFQLDQGLLVDIWHHILRFCTFNLDVGPGVILLTIYIAPRCKREWRHNRFAAWKGLIKQTEIERSGRRVLISHVTIYLRTFYCRRVKRNTFECFFTTMTAKMFV